MKTANALIRRNVKLFFKDKGMFFTSLATPLILLVLYGTFLKNVYRDSFLSMIPDMCLPTPKLIDALVGSQLMSSLLAVSCVTVAFCSNFLMVQDKANGTIKDLRISPVKPRVLSLSYYISTLLCTLLVCVVALAACLVYVATVGWYLTVSDVALLLLDVILLVLFGTALSSVINLFLSTQGQISAVGSIISSAYGFICGAYMPISSFSDGLQKVISFLPGTYGTALMRTHAMDTVLNKMQTQGVPAEVIDTLRQTLDCNISLMGSTVSIWGMYLILGGATVALLALYILLHKKNRQ